MAIGLHLANSASANVIFHDDFSSGNRDGWFSQSEPDGGISVDLDNNLVLDSVTWNTTNRSFLTYFDESTIGIGETIILSFTINITSLTNTSSGYRFGLLYSDDSKVTEDMTGYNDPVFAPYTGYAGFQNFGGATPVNQLIRERTGGANSLWTPTTAGGFDNLLTTQSQQYNVPANTFIDVSLAIENIGGTTASITTIVNGVAVSTQDTSTPKFTFDTIAIGAGNQANTEWQFGEFTVTVIPEPALFPILAGVAVLGIVLVRRRKTS